MTNKETRIIKSVKKGLLSFLIQPIYLPLITLPHEFLVESTLGSLLLFFFMLPLLPGALVFDLITGGNIHANDQVLIAIPSALVVNMLLHSACIYAFLYRKEARCNRSSSGE